jgi:hypothetical protein
MHLFLKTLSVATLVVAASGCSSFIDINQNPNSPTSVTPNFLLGQALSITAANYTGANPNTGVSFNTYGSFAADYWSKSGVVNGYNEERTYNYSNSYYAGLWSGTYDNLQDYQLIQNNGAAAYPNHAAIARIMKVYNYLLLVDEYGDIPYTNALQGLSNLTPKYDKAQDIYKDFIVQLDGAISDINKAAAGTVTNPVGSEDIVFGGNMTNWKKFANSLKLRILLRESQTNDAALNTYVKTQMTTLQSATDGFITADVVAQPGYAQSSGQQNPFYNRYGATSAGQQATERLYQLPTNFILAQYQNNNDPRVSQLYQIGKRVTAGSNDSLFYVGANLGDPSYPLFASSGKVIGSRFLLGGGLLKGLNAATPLMLLSEHLFSKAEAETRGLFSGGDDAAASDFNNGILASFLYFYRSASAAPAELPTNVSTSTLAGVSQYRTYIAANTNATDPTKSNPNVVYTRAASNGALGKQAVILLQKYLALNTVGSIEAWDDYRRAAQPQIMPSLESISPLPNKLPARLIYPLSEVNTNAANIPAGTSQFTKIFWDVVD